MKVIFTKTFLSNFEKKFPSIRLEILSSKIKQKFQSQPLYLKRPYVKLKFTIDKISFRFVGKYDQDRFILLPIFIFKKSNKQKGQNIIWKDIEKDIFQAMEKINNDLLNGDYSIY